MTGRIAADDFGQNPKRAEFGVAIAVAGTGPAAERRILLCRPLAIRSHGTIKVAGPTGRILRPGQVIRAGPLRLPANSLTLLTHSSASR